MYIGNTGPSYKSILLDLKAGIKGHMNKGSQGTLYHNHVLRGFRNLHCKSERPPLCLL